VRPCTVAPYFGSPLIPEEVHVSEIENPPLVSGWAYAALRPEVANSAAAKVAAPLSEVPRQHGDVRLTPVAHAFLAYWWHIRGDKPMPDAHDVSLPQMRTLSPYVRYLHWDGDALIHRLWGSALTEGVGVDMTGEDLIQYIPIEKREANHAVLRALHEQPCGVVLVVRDEGERGSGISAELSFLPVAAPNGQGQRLIGTMQWRQTEGVLSAATTRSGTGDKLMLECVSFMDLGAGTADPELLERL
jgi:hypothetical protein